MKRSEVCDLQETIYESFAQFLMTFILAVKCFSNGVTQVEANKYANIFANTSCEKIRVMASSVISSRKDAPRWEKVNISRLHGEIDA